MVTDQMKSDWIKDDIKKLEKAIQELGSSRWSIHESFSYFSDAESINVLSMASELIASIEEKKSTQMNALILKDENNFKLQQNCQKTVRCAMCGKKEYGECQT